jgi:hypothetical protein
MTSPPSQRLSLASPGRVILCALAGALVCSSLLVSMEGFRWIARSSESGGVVHNLFWISLLVLDKMFLSPWGAIGALVGAGVAWLTLSVRTALNPGEMLLGCGLVAVIGSVVFIHFVMGWLLAAPMAVLAMILLLAGIVRARDRSAPADRQWTGIGLLLPGMIVLLVSAFMAASVSLEMAMRVQQPQFSAWHHGSIPRIGQFLGLWGGWLFAPLIINLGLSSWTNWSVRRRVCWCLIIPGVPPSVLVVHQVLSALGGPLTA